VFAHTQPDNTHLVTGLSDGMLSIRHRPQKSSERSQALAKKNSLQGGSHRSFLRARRIAKVRFAFLTHNALCSHSSS
jgi:U3 small nucleolar RNA-associated protein 15